MLSKVNDLFSSIRDCSNCYNMNLIKLGAIDKELTSFIVSKTFLPSFPSSKSVLFCKVYKGIFFVSKLTSFKN